jgi:hypothetical protein
MKVRDKDQPDKAGLLRLLLGIAWEGFGDMFRAPARGRFS